MQRKVNFDFELNNIFFELHNKYAVKTSIKLVKPKIIH